MDDKIEDTDTNTKDYFNECKFDEVVHCALAERANKVIRLKKAVNGIGTIPSSPKNLEKVPYNTVL